MSTMYKVMAGSILTVDVARTSEDSVWEILLNGAEVRKSRVPKSDKQPAYFDDIAEAKAFLLTSARQGVEAAAKRLESAKARYQQIADM